MDGQADSDSRIAPPDEGGVAEAVRLLRAGQPVALPTETVYGLAADATDGAAVARIYAAKARPQFNPLIVHVPDLTAARILGQFDPPALRLARAFWPGPLTLVVARQPDCQVATLASAGLPSVALRVPAHPVFQAVLRALGRPLAAPSANRSGRISPTRAAHVQASLGGRVALVLDGGPCAHGIESTIVAVAGNRVRLLRPGAIPLEAIAAAAGVAVEAPDHAARIEAPGQSESHYAPVRPLRLNATARQPGEWLIGFGPVAGDATLSARGDLAEAAAALYDRLHEADVAPAKAIAVAPVPATGLGVAINDRLRRAAHG